MHGQKYILPLKLYWWCIQTYPAIIWHLQLTFQMLTLLQKYHLTSTKSSITTSSLISIKYRVDYTIYTNSISCLSNIVYWPLHTYNLPVANVTSHYSDVIMGAMVSHITSLTIVYSTVYWGPDQRKLCEGNSPVTGELPAQMANNAENVSIWWHHHEISLQFPFKCNDHVPQFREGLLLVVLGICMFLSQRSGGGGAFV